MENPKDDLVLKTMEEIEKYEQEKNKPIQEKLKADVQEYINSFDLEHNLDVEKKQTCRDIVKEIKRFGVSQRQMLYIIYLMAMELEHRETMLAIIDAAKYGRKQTFTEDKKVTLIIE